MPAVVDDKRLEGLVRAPDFPPHLEWLNTPKKISLKDLKGKIVLLDFWTYCCINCMHVIPDLKKLEAKYPQELVVIGVHSAKFFNEKGTESIRQAVMRYEIKHPVLNDKEMEVWNEYGVNSWPTLVLINPNGRIIGTHSGEEVFDLFDSLIAQAIPYFEKKKQLNRAPLKLKLEEARRPNTLLSFPGKVRADIKNRRLFISDSNHNRILVTDPEGQVLEIIGNGRAGQADGSFETAELRQPQGTFAEGDILYIADTENHLIRAADLKTREVKTIFGTGQKARESGGRGAGTKVPLNSPWDLVVFNGRLYIAMAGSHQIYTADLKTLEIKPYAGSGREARVDGPLREAALAQPSGITTDGVRLYFADSEVSAVRSASLPEGEGKGGGKVETIIGENLFVFGDVDGGLQTARLQHPLGLEFDGGLLYVADTYNSKIKVINPLKKTSETYAGTGAHGYQDGALNAAQFFEPGGVAVLDERIYIADTNNHQIRVLDRKARTVSTLALSSLDKMAKQTLNPFKGRTVEWPPRTIQEGKATVRLSYKLPEGYKFNYEAPLHMEWKSEEKTAVEFTGKSNQLDGKKVSFPLEIPVTARLGRDTFIFDAVIYFCREKSSICLFDQVRVKVPVEVKKSGASLIDIQVDLLAKA